jgi:hypothetical protein
MFSCVELQFYHGKKSKKFAAPFITFLVREYHQNCFTEVAKYYEQILQLKTKVLKSTIFVLD